MFEIMEVHSGGYKFRPFIKSEHPYSAGTPCGGIDGGGGWGRREMGRGSWTASNHPGCHGNLVTMATSSVRAGYHGNELRMDWLSRLVTRADLIYDDVSLVINVCILIIYIFISYIIL